MTDVTPSGAPHSVSNRKREREREKQREREGEKERERESEREEEETEWTEGRPFWLKGPVSLQTYCHFPFTPEVNM